MSFWYDTWEKILILRICSLSRTELQQTKMPHLHLIWIRGVAGTLKFTRSPQDWEFESMENFFELLNCNFGPKDGLDLLEAFKGRKT